jgi:hypothetical protein
MDYSQWYANVFSAENVGSIKFGLANQFDNIGPTAVGSPTKPSPINAHDIIMDAAQLVSTSTGGARGERDYTLPDGTEMQGSGNAGVDFLNGILGTSPLSGADDAKTVDGESVAPGSGGVLDTSLLGNWFGRVTIILLGLIFVAVGLTMFKPAVVQVAKDAVRV